MTPIDTRAVVAMAGAFGYELELNLLSGEDKAAWRLTVKDHSEALLSIVR